LTRPRKGGNYRDKLCYRHTLTQDLPLRFARAVLTLCILGASRLTVVVEYTDSIVQPQWKLLASFLGNDSVKPITDPFATNAARFYRTGLRQ